MKAYYKKLICIFAFSLVAVANSRADMLVTKSGEELYGTTLKVQNEGVTFLINKEEKVFKKEDILRIDFTKETLSNKFIPLADIKDETLNEAIAKKVAPESYPNAGYVKLYSEHSYTYTKDHKLIASQREIIQILQERGKNAGVISLSYKKGVQTAQVEHGRTINDGKVYSYDQSSLRESSLFFNYPDYDKMYFIKYPLSNIVVGSVLDSARTLTQSVIDTFDPFYTDIYFSANEPVLKQRLIIKFPKGGRKFDISLQFMGEEGKDYTFKESEEDEYVVHTYEKENIKAIEEESYMPSNEMIMPRIVLSISPDFNKIRKDFSERLKKLLVINAPIKDKVNELTINTKTNEEKIANIYKYIVKEIGLDPVDPSNYSYLPNQSNYIYGKKSGSYIDNAFLLYSFLKTAGIDCEFALVKERNSGEVLEKTPNIKQFNYPIVIVPLDFTTFYLSPLNKDLMITDIDAQIQGGAGLILSNDSGDIIKVPLKSAEKENVSKSFIIDLFEDGSINVKETTTFSGNNQGAIRGFQYMPEKNLKQYLLEMAHGIHPNAELIDYKFDNLDDLNTPPKMEINYYVKEYMISAGGELLAFKLPSLSYSAYEVGKNERNYPLSFGALVSNNKKYVVRMPNNYKIYYLPVKRSYNSDNFVYEASYKEEGNEIKFSDSYKRLGVFMPKEAYFELKKCLETRAELAKEWIVIQKETSANEISR